MLLLKEGDHLPTVAVVQRALNQQMARLGGLKVDVTGEFDAATVSLVVAFQQKLGLSPDGIVGPATWRRLSMGHRLQIMDHVDAADDYHDSDTDAGYEWDLWRVGANPIVSYTQSGGLMLAAERILRANQESRVILLRFHGHGGPGRMAVTEGRGTSVYGATRFSLDNTDWHEVHDHFQPLRTMFHPLGSVELHGCNVAGDAHYGGRRVAVSGAGIGVYLLRRLAQLWQVPVTASPNSQYSHGRAILPFEGRTVTVCPNGVGAIEEWAQGKSV